jgi:hypothetical protein
VHDDHEIEEAIAAEVRELGSSLITMPNSFNITHRATTLPSATIIAAANRLGLPFAKFSPEAAG